MRDLLVPLVLALGGASTTACDPVHSNAVDALGGEAPGVRTGPTHRPGQPCLLCHDGKLGDPPPFSVAGTIFLTPNDPRAANGVDGASVVITDATGDARTFATNQAGNFYVPVSEWTPTYPLRVRVTYRTYDVTMTSHIGRDGSCAGCHFTPTGPDSPGPVALDWGDGGVP